ncbi:MAG: IMPACT family protein [Spirochaetota bacterium]
MADTNATLRVPASRGEVSLRIKNSRFIAVLIPVSTQAEVDEALAGLHAQHPGATHIVYAFSLGPPMSRLLGQSDAGEPKGTAGRPVLAVVEGKGVTNALLSVVRYFGGTKLGTGGLVRAYGEAAAAVMEAVRLTPLRRLCAGRVEVDYATYEPVRNLVTALGGAVLREEYGTTVSIDLIVPEEARDELAAALRDRTRGVTEPIFGEPYWG